MIPIAEIHILNPRSRTRRIHKDIVDNIKAVGLKRPITVSRRRENSGNFRYDLVCGQGRMEAYQILGQANIPAFIAEASEDDCLVMSLVENVARRSHRPIDLMREVGELKSRGHDDADIARLIGCTTSWVGMIGGLLEKGEDRLLAAVEGNIIPLSLAVTIARSDESDTQNLLTDAYEGGIKGKRFAALRRLLSKREKRQKMSDPKKASPDSRKKMSIADLHRLYEREAEKQRLMAKKVEFMRQRLIFATEAIKDLLIDPNFSRLIKEEGLDSLPTLLKNRIDARCSA
jgi:ParB family chromosome partitioning protein